jgi:hypothetical protein
MANKKITELALLQQTAFAPTDAIPIVDDSATETKRTTVAELDLRWAAKVHNHIITDVTGLVSALNAKEATITAGTTFQYYRGDKTWQTLDKNAVGLNNVDNTSDANKPISTATQTALDLKQSFVQDNLKVSFSIPANHTAIAGKIEIAINEIINIEPTGRLVLI